MKNILASELKENDIKKNYGGFTSSASELLEVLPNVPQAGKNKMLGSRYHIKMLISKQGNS